MTTSYIKISTNSELKIKAQEVFESLGLDFSTAINIFLAMTVEKNTLPFDQNTYKSFDLQLQQEILLELPFKRGCMKGKMWLSDDFCEPLSDFQEYME